MPPGRLRTLCAALSGLLSTLMFSQDFYSAHFALLLAAILSIVPAMFFHLLVPVGEGRRRMDGAAVERRRSRRWPLPSRWCSGPCSCC